MFKTPLFFNLHHHHFAPKDGCLQDFSSYLLFEATGDSEADASSVDPGGSSAAPGSPECNDAESCTDDTPDCDEFDMDEDENHEDGEEGENYEKNDDEVVESKATKGFTKSSASIDSTKEFKMLNEVDKNRLFWEACLAS